jgi:HemY protein
MIRLVVFLIAVLAVASGLAWLADRPGTLVLNWQGYEIQTSMFRAVVILSLIVAGLIMLWALLRQIWLSPALLGRYLTRQRQKRGLDALSSGMIAIGAGDRSAANKFTAQARKSLPNEPMTHLLRAQTAQLTGDRATAKRIYESMLSSPDTEQLGLRGLYLEATRMKEHEAARHFAERAMAANPSLSWPAEALFQLQCRNEDWPAALETLATLRRYGHIEKAAADRRRAVLQTAQAQILEDGKPDQALALALEAHGLAPDLIPAAAIAGRLLASRGNTAKAAKVVQKTWAKAPHPDLAVAYAYARIGDSPNDRMTRIKKLAALAPSKSPEAPIAVAVAAVEARRYDEARHALAPLLDEQLSQRVATLMARIEGEQNGDKGKVREWLARAISAQRDPAWTADGVVSDDWAPVSPLTGELDVFEWRVPVERLAGQNTHSLTGKAEELVAILAASTPAFDAVGGADSRDDDVIDIDLNDTTEPSADNAKSAEETKTTGSTSAGIAPASTPEPAAKAASRGAAETMDSATETPRRTVEEPVTSGPKLLRPEASVRIARTDEHQPDSNQTPPAPEAKSKTQEASKKPEQPKSKGRKSRGYGGKAAKPEVFVSPHAPDDPGPEGGETETTNTTFKPYGAAS